MVCTATARRWATQRGEGAAVSEIGQQCWRSSLCTEEAGGPYQKDDGGDEVEHGEFDFWKEHDTNRAHHAHNERPDQCPQEAAEATDNHDNKGQDEGVCVHTQHSCLPWHDDSFIETGHGAAQGKRLHIHLPYVDA